MVFKFLMSGSLSIDFSMESGIFRVDRETSRYLMMNQPMSISSKGNSDFGDMLHGIIAGFRFSTEISEESRMVPLSIFESTKDTIPEGSTFKIHVGGRVFSAIRDRNAANTHYNSEAAFIRSF